MASAINTKTGQRISRGISRDSEMGAEWVINPTAEEIQTVLDEVNAPTLDQAKAEKKAEAKAESDNVILNGFEFEGDIYSLNKDNQDDYNFMLTKKTKLPASFRLTLKNGSLKMLSKSKLDALTDSAFIHKMTALEAYKDKVELINSANNIEDLDEI